MLARIVQNAVSSGPAARNAVSAFARPLLQAQRVPLAPHQRANLSNTPDVSTQYQSSGAAASAPAELGAPGTRMYSSFGVYKGKAALQVKIIGPTWVSKQSTTEGPNGQGPTGPYMVLDKEGVLLLEFANVNPGAGYNPQQKPGDRTYNWNEKLMFSLKALELATIFTHDFKNNLSLYHDPNKGGPNEGAQYKSLAVTQNPDGYMFTCTVGSKRDNTRNSVNVQVSKAEFYVFQRLSDSIMNHLLGFDAHLYN